MIKPDIEYSIVIPVYNGAPYLEDLHKRLTDVLEKITHSYEIILVDDGSSDASWQVLCRLGQRDKKIKLIRLMKNFGQHNATLCGFRYSGGHYVITMDDDLQHPPEEIPKLISEIQKGYSLVYGRYDKKKHSLFRNLGSALSNKVLLNISDNKSYLTSFRAIKGSLVKAVRDFSYPSVIVDLWFMRVISKSDISYCEIQHEESATSNYHFGKLVQTAVNVMLNHTVIPIRIATFLGIFFSAVSFGLGFLFFGMYWLGHIDVSGFTTIVLLITFFFGILLFVMGIMGEYIAALFLILNKIPLYIVKEARMPNDRMEESSVCGN